MNNMSQKTLSISKVDTVGGHVMLSVLQDNCTEMISCGSMWTNNVPCLFAWLL